MKTTLLVLSLLLGSANAPIPESPLRIRPSAWYFRIKAPRDFCVARPESFGDVAHFRKVDMRFTVCEGVATVFGGYRTINPLKVWSSARSWLVAVHVPSLDRTLYRDDLATGWPGFEPGMKVFIDMSALPVAVTNRPAMMVALEITRLDPATRTVEYRYLEGTPSYGKQQLTFRPSPNDPGATEILHETWYRSYSPLIESFYPHYHRQMLRGMHGRYKQEIEEDAAPRALAADRRVRSGGG